VRPPVHRARSKCDTVRQGRRVSHVLIAIVCAAAALSARAGQTYDRWVHLQGAANFRDVGDYDAGTTAIVRAERVFRSDELDEITTGDSGVICLLGIRTIIDLRTTDVVAIYPDSPLLDAFATHIYIPTSFPPAYSTTETYRLLVTQRGEQWRQAFEVLADPANLPLNYHCRAGKDRAGVLTALLLTFLGVRREVVLQDYLLSNIAYGWIVVEQSWIEEALDAVDDAGGIESYLTSIGVTQSVRQAIRDNLLILRSTSVRSPWHLYR